MKSISLFVAFAPIQFAIAVLKLIQINSKLLGPAAGGATALPATPRGYLATTINNTAVRIPYYN